MKKVSLMFLITLMAAFLCIGATADAKTKKKLTQAEKISYGIGFSIGKKMVSDDLKDIDYDLLVKGMKDAFANAEPMIEEVEMRAAFEAQRKKKMSKQKVQGDANIKKAEAFLEDNAKKKGVKLLEEGLQYKILKSGSGKTPGYNSDVVLHYKGTNLDGKEFDSSYKRGAPATMKASGLIPGFGKALVKMKEGDKWVVYIHPKLAYGPNSPSPFIGPNAMLTFEIEVIEVK